MTSLRNRKDAARPTTIIAEPDLGELISFYEDATRRASAVRIGIYGRTSPRDGLEAFDARGMDIVEGRR